LKEEHPRDPVERWQAGVFSVTKRRVHLTTAHAAELAQSLRLDCPDDAQRPEFAFSNGQAFALEAEEQGSDVNLLKYFDWLARPTAKTAPVEGPATKAERERRERGWREQEANAVPAPIEAIAIAQGRAPRKVAE
jgi:hypothetical protein